MYPVGHIAGHLTMISTALIMFSFLDGLITFLSGADLFYFLTTKDLISSFLLTYSDEVWTS